MLNPALRGSLLFLLLTVVACMPFRDASAAEHPLVGEFRHITGKQVDVVTHQITGRTKFLHFADGYSVAASPVMRKSVTAGGEEAAAAFLERYGVLFGINNPGKDLAIKKKVTDKGKQFIRYQQHFSGLPVIGGELVVQVDGSSIVSVGGKASNIVELATQATILPEQARETALKMVVARYPGAGGRLETTEPVLSIYNPALLGHTADTDSLVWKLEVNAVDAAPVNVLVLVDALNGTVLLHFNQIDYAKSRKVYDNNNIRSDSLPGTNLQRLEGSSPSTVSEVNAVYDYLGDTYDFFSTYHGRDSVDNQGLPLVGTVRFCSTDSLDSCPYDNAFWSSTKKQMVCGQGQCTDDTVGHEITHGIIDNEAQLYYYMQSGAINESLADVWGEFIDQVNGKGNDAPSQKWLFSEDSGTIRNMSNPPAYGDPDRMRSSLYFCGSGDNGGVHYNSGVNNKAAFLMTDGGTFNGKTVTGLGITKVAKIYYEALTRLLVSASDYEDLYYALKTSCSNLVATGVTTAADCQEVAKALDAVEMNLQPAACQAPEAPVCDAGRAPVDFFFDDFESGPAKWLLSVAAGDDPWSDMNGNLINSTPYASSGTGHLWGYDNSTTSDSSVRTASPIHIPAGAYLHFRHAYDFEFDASGYYDGGVVEYSTNGGSSWNDAKTLFTTNGYTHTLYSSTTDTNPLKGRSAFSGISNGYVSSRLNLSSLAGSTILVRFRIGTDSNVGADGWFIDDVRLYTCSAAPADTTAPVVSIFTMPATATALTVGISSFAATDGVGVTGYLVTESPATPAVTAAGWNSTPQTSFTFSGAGTKTAYAWAKDSAGNVSLSLPATTTITLPGDGSCGTSNGGTFTTIPAANLCSAGTASAVSGAGPWSWSCLGSLGGTTADCFAFMDITGPALTMSTLANGAITNNATLNVSGTVSDASGVARLTINTAAVTITNGSFSHAIILQPGTNSITSIATDTLGNSTTDTRAIILDTTAPVVSITTPADNSMTSQPLVPVTGTISETSTVTVAVNSGTPQSASISGNNFSATLALNPGINTADITVIDLAGNTSTAKRTITYDNSVPSLTVSTPAQDMFTTQAGILFRGTVSDTVTSAAVSITTDGQSYAPAVAQDGSFTQSVLLPADKTYAVLVTATDQAGNSASVQRNIIKTALLTQPTMGDALKVMLAVTGTAPLTASERIRYDVAPLGLGGVPGGNGIIDIADVILILRRSIGIGSW
jgi:Zn-dependent metalloprotease